jgi:hypothetical protein
MRGWLLVTLCVGASGCVCAVGNPETGDSGTASDSGADSGLTSDAGSEDAGRPDSGHADAGLRDAGEHDAGLSDASTTDAGEIDGGRTDAGGSDAGTIDSGTVDSGICSNDPGCSNAGEMACDPAGSNEIGTCTLVGECLKVTGLAACPSMRQTCSIGANACKCAIDPLCPNGANGASCGTNNNVVTCAQDSGGCVYASSNLSCMAPTTCTGSAPNAQCTCPAAGSGVGQGCSTAGATQCDATTNNVDTCTAQSTCLVWQQSSNCVSQGLLCETTSMVSACECPVYVGTDFYADSVGGSPSGSAPYPTGAQSPAACRFKKLGDAVGAANASGPGAQAIATGFVTGGTPETFSGETLPLTVDNGVTLTTTDSPLNPANYHLDFDSSTAPSAILLSGGSTFSGFTVTNAGGNPAGDAVDLSCAKGGTVEIDSVLLVGASPNGDITNGLNVSGSCTVTTTELSAQNFKGAGVLVSAAASSASTSLSGGTISANATGLQLTLGQLTLTNVAVSNSTGVGIDDVPGGGDTVLAVTGGKVNASAQDGIIVNAGTGATVASKVTITSTNVTGNVTGGGAHAGITVLARTASLVGVNVHANEGTGLLVSTSPGGTTSPQVTVTSGTAAAHFDANAGVGSNGITVTAGTLTATSATASNNIGAGAHVAGDATHATFHGCTFNGNGTVSELANGVEVESGTVTIDTGSVLDGNTHHGLEIVAGSVTVTGTPSASIDFSTNGINGVDVPAGGAVTVGLTEINSHNNGNHGLEVNNANGTGRGGSIIVQGSTFSDNKLAGIYVDQSAATTTIGDSLTISGCTFAGNTHSINVAPLGTATVWATIQQNTMTGATDTALLVTGTSGSSLSITGNDINKNNAVTLNGTQLAGGVILTGTPPDTWTFTTNLVHGNQGDQVLAIASNTGGATGTWNLSTSLLCASCVNANTFSCYDDGVAPGYVGVVALGGVTVSATGDQWQNSPPKSGQDYATYLGGTVNVGCDCGASTLTCPVP